LALANVRSWPTTAVAGFRIAAIIVFIGKFWQKGVVHVAICSAGAVRWAIILLLLALTGVVNHGLQNVIHGLH
jgi:hypothetical protein